jgi:hypothetical protein
MRLRLLWVFLASLNLIGAAQAAESLARWAADFEKPETQQKILDRIFPGQIGSVSSAQLDKNSQMYIFPKVSTWARLGKDVVFSSSASGARSLLAVSCMFYRSPESEPTSATSYLFSDPARRPVAISGGYATHERVQAVTLSKLGKSFLLVMASSGQGTEKQWSASLQILDAAGTSSRPQTVWLSPTSLRQFQLGFDDLGGAAEELLLRKAPKQGGEVEYVAYRWNGSRFELDDFAFESRMKALPEDVWRYGAGQ